MFWGTLEYLKVPFLSNTQYPLGQLTLAPSKVPLANIWLEGELSLFLTLNGASEFVATFEVVGAVVEVEGVGVLTEIFNIPSTIALATLSAPNLSYNCLSDTLSQKLVSVIVYHITVYQIHYHRNKFLLK